MGTDLLQRCIDGCPNGKGLALIVGCDQGPGFKFLHGVEKDVPLMEATFRGTLKYCTWLLNNPTRKELFDALVTVARHQDYPPSYKRFVFIFAGHGLHGKLVLSDGQVGITEEIIGPLEAKDAPSLSTMPKLFFIDACRGNEKDRGITVASRGGEAVESIKVPKKGNMLIAYSTLPHYEALEGSDGGFWLRRLSQELRTSKASILDVLATVRGKVLEECRKLSCTNVNQLQVSETNDTLLEPVYFLKEAEDVDGVEAMDTGTSPGTLDHGHIPLLPTTSALRNEQHAHVPGPATSQLLKFLEDNRQKLDEKYVEDAATGVARYKCILECLCGGQRKRVESGYHPTREASTEEAAVKLLPVVRSLAPRSGPGEEARPPAPVKQLADHFRREGREVKYDTKRTPNKRYLSHVFVPDVGRVEGKEERSEERAKNSAATEALKKLKLL